MTDKNDTDAVAERIADSVREQMNDENSRRSFLSRSAVAGSALLAIGGGTGLALADEHEGEGDGESPMESTFDDVQGTDVDVLNYALSLEMFESAFYTTALEKIDEQMFVESEALGPFPEEQRAQVYGQIETIANQEAEHVQVLTQVVEMLGGKPAEAPEFEFEIEDVEGFLAQAQAIENLGVSAYAGAAPYIESPDLLSAALSIHSVEARHSALLNTLSGDSPFPDAFDAAAAQTEVLDTVGQFTAGDSEMPTGDEDGTGNETGGNGNETAGNGNDTAGTGNDTAGTGNETGGNGNDTAGTGNETSTPQN